jgi:2-polyprenyl-3-methyl-5-hydroxy-6-metoxy-1,4-benzoquinol methylase
MPQQLFADIPIESVADYWNRRPCNIRHSPREIGTRAYFDEVEQRKYFVEPHIPRFADFPRWKDCRVLEIGCGIGTDTVNFARHGAQVTAVDLSAKSLEIAQQRAAVFGYLDRVRFFQGNVEELTRVLPVEPYDLVYSFGVLHHTPNPDRALEQIGHYLHADSTLKLMLYYRYAWKVFWLLSTLGKGMVWKLSDLIAQHSEAQVGCPVTYTYSRKEACRLLERHGLTISEAWVDHIFPYRIEDYQAYRYVKEWYFRNLPPSLFRRLERRFGWHLCLTAQPAGKPAAASHAFAIIPLNTSPRAASWDARPAGSGLECFDTAEANALNRARIEHLDALDLQWHGKRVLDVGCGVGHLAAALRDRGCEVVAVDGRDENIERLRVVHPEIESVVLNVEQDSLEHLGRFDIVLCYGLLYHLENPLAALRNLASVCDDTLLVETIICDRRDPVLVLQDETLASNQALQGLGCRPSPSYVAMALSRVGFPFVHAPRTPPDHPDFRIYWTNNGDWQRNGHPLRAVFVGARTEMAAGSMTPLVQPESATTPARPFRK